MNQRVFHCVMKALLIVGFLGATSVEASPPATYSSRPFNTNLTPTAGRSGSLTRPRNIPGANIPGYQRPSPSGTARGGSAASPRSSSNRVPQGRRMNLPGMNVPGYRPPRPIR